MSTDTPSTTDSTAPDQSDPVDARIHPDDDCHRALVVAEHEESHVRAVVLVGAEAHPQAAGEVLDELSIEVSHVTHHGIQPEGGD